MDEVVSVHPAATITVEQMREVWTFEDVQQLDVDDWWRYEIVDGSLVVSPSAGGNHELAGMRIALAVAPVLPADFAIVGPMGVDLGASYLIPDLLVAPEGAIRDRSLVVAVDVVLAVEIVSPGSVSMDRLVKPAKYAAAGIQHYWRVEIDPVSLTAYRLADGVYTEVGAWGAGRTARLTEPFAVELDLARLLPA